MRSAIDNDVLFKGAWFAITNELLAAMGVIAGEAFVLGQARFVISKRIQKQSKKRPGAPAALARFNESLAALNEVEPTAEEIRLAAQLENAAMAANLEFDSGESLLCAVTFCRQLDALATGDKRAVGALPLLDTNSDALSYLRGRVICLEQLVLAALNTGDAASLRRSICSESHADTALSACFSCSSPEVGPEQWAAGLQSYIQALRAAAPDWLRP
jgi:hypothetical protein